MKNKKPLSSIDSIARLIENSAEKIIDNISHESIEVYCHLRTLYNTTDILANRVFQFLYRSFFRLDNAGLTEELKLEYFKLLANYQVNGNFDLSEAVLHLYNFKTKQDKNSVQFSFCTKMGNMIDERLPIYDSEVASVFGFKEIYNIKNLEAKIKTYENRLEKISADYNTIIEKSLVPTTLIAFDKKFSGSLGLHKKLDFIFWSAGKLKLNKKI